MSVVIIVFDHRRRLIGLPNSYESLIQKARTEFNLGDADLLVQFIPPSWTKRSSLILLPTTPSPTKASFSSPSCTHRHWEFSILYPIVEPTILSGKSSAKWQVSVSPDGTLETLEASGPNLECSYLFWEAEAVAGDSIAPELFFNFPFNPQRPLLCFKGPTALILSFDDFLPYLEKVLQTLTLTPAMRTEFIVYWLPKFMKIRDRGQDIAFDFVPQLDFQKVAHLEIEPRPDTVARVFLIFRGAFKQTHGQKTLAELEAIDWSARIGIDVAGMKDTSTFRALEWGGMEVITV
ncbi:unnamed protein product [Colletotrichum noveboracense]|uniref:Uncharacterized protein n=1 Tax=Colletotrichum noveboracense TaxID=2664923 RepID=A0A9W4S1K0_9PEZI|nr:unnamed protein product [Colletotrichum noveboracense]